MICRNDRRTHRSDLSLVINENLPMAIWEMRYHIVTPHLEGSRPLLTAVTTTTAACPALRVTVASRPPTPAPTAAGCPSQSRRAVRTVARLAQSRGGDELKL